MLNRHIEIYSNKASTLQRDICIILLVRTL